MLPPLPAPFTEVFPPERSLGLDSTYNALRWTDHPEWRDGYVTSLGSDTMCAHYIYRTMQVPRDTTFSVSLGSDDGITVWLNGQKVLAHNIDRGANADQERLNVSLHSGSNSILIKINNHFGPSGFFFALIDSDMRLLWENVRRDFPDSTSRREMEWENEDSIWATEWSPGDVLPLAIRYADKSMCETFAESHALGIKARIARTPSDLADIRNAYLVFKEAELTKTILTPKVPAAPRINWPRRIGARPGHPFLFTIPISGDRPIMVRASGLPRDLRLDPASGIITGRADRPGKYTVSAVCIERPRQDQGNHHDSDRPDNCPHPAPWLE